MKIESALLLVALATLLASCQDPASPAKPRSLEFSADGVTLVADDSLLAAATLTLSDGSPGTGYVIQYSSSNEAVATVSSAGRLHAVAAGTATITARQGLLSDAIEITVVPQFLELAVGETHACGITGKHELYCWGSNGNGELGVDSLTSCGFGGSSCTSLPVRVTGADRFVAVTLGLSHTCALTAAGDAYCWGGNLNGALGVVTSNTRIPIPTPVAGDLKFTSLASGRLHTCGITTQGDTYCWGWDFWGQLGTGSAAMDRCNFLFANSPCSLTPVKVAGGQTFSKLWASDRATCGQTASNMMYCWGLEVGGSEKADCQFGQIARCTRTPLLQASGANFPVFGMGELMRCGQEPDGRIQCWGTDYNNFGNGADSAITTSTPISVASGHRFVDGSIAVGRLSVCARDPNVVECWGNGSQGQVGGTIGVNRNSAAIISGLGSDIERIVSSPVSDTNCAKTSDGRAYCWGDGRFGQLGNGSFVSSAAAVQVKLVR